MPNVDEILHQYALGAEPARVRPLGSAGGMSGAKFWRVSLADTMLAADASTMPYSALANGNGSRASRSSHHRFALRRWPAEHPAPDRLRFIHAVLGHAVRHGVAVVPLPIRTATGETFVRRGRHLWELAPWMPGKADFRRAPNTARLRAAMIALAKFHVAVADYSESSQRSTIEGRHAVARHFARLMELAHRGVKELTKAINKKTWPEFAPLAHQFVEALPRVVPPALAQLEPLASVPLPLQPCIRDIWHDHILFTGDEVTGIVDFGALDIDTPATDIARLLDSLSSFVNRKTVSPLRAAQAQQKTWQAGIDAYSSVRPLSPEELQAAGALNASGTILSGSNWIRWIYIDKRTFSSQEQVLDRFRRIVERLG
jgi:homoserine kinase type II